MERLRKAGIIASVIAAAWGMSAGLDTHNLLLWAVSVIWLAIVGLAQLWQPENKKRRRGNYDAKHE